MRRVQEFEIKRKEKKNIYESVKCMGDLLRYIIYMCVCVSSTGGRDYTEMR